jgi:predicted neuraminidase
MARSISVLLAAVALAAFSRPSPLRGFGATATQDAPFLTSELVFPLEHWHNHASMIVEAPNGDLLVDWFHGSGERTADDVVVRGARLKKWAKA